MPAPRPIVTVILICALALSSACSSMTTIDPVTAPEPSPFGNVRAGDTVVIHLTSGERRRFVVRAIDGDHLVGDNGSRFARGEITTLQRRSFSGPKTAFLVGSLAAGSVVLLLAAAQAAVLGGWQ